MNQEEQPPAGMLDIPGVTADAVSSFFDAAALFYEQAPWQQTSDRPIEVACAAFESGPWFAVVMGQGGIARGLALYDNMDVVQRIQQGNRSEKENALLTTGWMVSFGSEDDLAPPDGAAGVIHGWRVAGPEAFPSIYRLDRGLSMRPPLAWELRLLEGCLRGIPEFLRKKNASHAGAADHRAHGNRRSGCRIIVGGGVISVP